MLEDVLSNPVTFVQWVRRGIPGDWLASLVGETGLEHEIAIALGMTSTICLRVPLVYLGRSQVSPKWPDFSTVLGFSPKFRSELCKKL